MRIVFVLVLVFILSVSRSQTIDVQHYRFQIQVSDENDKISGRAQIIIKYLQSTQDVSLNLVQQTPNGKGMKVDSVKGKNVSAFQQQNNLVQMHFSKPVLTNATDTIELIYSGIPEDGLIISKNKFGDRTFFSDNWPNRAQHWIPCHDVVSDKASVEFIVVAPAYYQVVSNGVQVEETNINKNLKLTHWKEATPIPTKVMVIGVAQFAVAKVDSDDAVPVTAWVYPQNKQKGFYDYAQAVSILKYFTNYIAPFPFQKLANVQSKTIFGGMENAGAIFYEENSVTGNRTAESLLSHEIVHQWFGDMASEKSFAHLWLSEGFATYLTDVYWEHMYGEEAFQKRLIDERAKVIRFAQSNHMPVIDSISPLMELLNENSYQKGSWVLHMLRSEVGDENFHAIIRSYYQQYKGANADTRDFQKVAEKISGRNLQTFFDQWLYQPGVPKLKLQWKFSGDKIDVVIEQAGKAKFTCPLTIALVDTKGRQVHHKLLITSTTNSFSIPVATKPVKIILDPDVDLLFEGSVEEKK